MSEVLRRPRREFDKRYEKLVESLRSQISMGRLRRGDMISSENQLASQFSMSRNSVRAAIQLLVDEGLLVKAPGKGTFVTSAAHVEVQHLRIAVPTPSHDANSIVARMREWAQRDGSATTIDVSPFPVANFEVTARTLAERGGADVILVNDLILRHLDPATLETCGDLVDDESALLPAAISSFTVDGSLRGVPVVCSPTLLALDTSVPQRRTWPTSPTWADIHDLALGSRSDETDNGFAVSLHSHRLAAWLGQNEAYLADSTGAPLIDSPRVEETIDFLLSLSSLYRQPRFSGGAVISAEQNFGTGLASGVLTTTINVPDFAERPRPWTIARPPVGRVAFAPLITIGVAIPAAGAHKARARELARWLASEPAQIAITRETTSFPTRVESIPQSWPHAIAGATFAPLEALEQAQPLEAIGPTTYLNILSTELLSRPFEPDHARAAIAAAQARALAANSHHESVTTL